MLDLATIRRDSEVEAIMEMSEKQIEALGFTEHSRRHAGIVSKWSGEILRALGKTEERVRLAEIAGYLHDIGNCINRKDHAQSGAILSYKILTRLGMSAPDAAEIMMAIGNHDEQYGQPVSDVSSALIIADKADVHKSRVKNAVSDVFKANIHDRVNLAAERSFVKVEEDGKVIALHIEIDTAICSVMDYFEIYFGRMQLSRKAAEFLSCRFSLVINGAVLL
ncbi:MAG TPA: HD domain-containing protein [Firmicutes bacterium]|nr:HD domain-containing protein [Bacillota bacterium]